MTQPPLPIQPDLIERQFERLNAIEDALANGAERGDDPECHPLYPQAVAARQILREHITTLEPKAISYDHIQEIAVELGYPSALEALEQLERVTEALEPFANLEHANMNDPLHKWLTIAHIKNADQALAAPQGGV